MSPCLSTVCSLRLPSMVRPGRTRVIEYWPGSVHEVVQERWKIEKWVDFYWDGFGPTSSISQLHLLELASDDRDVCVVDELEPFRAVARIRGGDDPLVFSGLLKRILDGNGDAFGLNLWPEACRRKPPTTGPTSSRPPCSSRRSGLDAVGRGPQLRRLGHARGKPVQPPDRTQPAPAITRPPAGDAAARRRGPARRLLGGARPGKRRAPRLQPPDHPRQLLRTELRRREVKR